MSHFSAGYFNGLGESVIVGTALPLIRPDDFWAVAQTIWGEAHLEPFFAQVGVGWVILNRQRYAKSWARMTLFDICRAVGEFACWNNITLGQSNVLVVQPGTPGFSVCIQLAIKILSGELASNVGRATRYYITTSGVPTWAVGKTPIAAIGHLVFFEGNI